ncbi:MAG: bacillithiol biosynthesis cysteine-adding enzyme BshC [Ferruginibacter sp.]
MELRASHLSYQSTGYFSKIVIDYLEQSPELQSFYGEAPTLNGIKKAIVARKKFTTDRKLLVTELRKQYSSIQLSAKQEAHLVALNDDNCFTVTTAHQPNIFTGHLYFIYKILHAIKLAAYLKEQLPENNFVPVYYIGSEDADLDELGEVFLNGTEYHWRTKQTGAVGRMKVDDELLKIIDAIAGQVLVEKYGNEIIDLIRQCYTKGAMIEQATFKLVNQLFAEYGLITLLPDNAALKQTMLPVFEDDLLNNIAGSIVEKTSAELAEHFKAQAYPREINLFYLKDNRRERIEKKKEQFVTVDTQQIFSRDEMITELKSHPERFSPNVILRGLYQETILPDIAFVGGGGELAYWLQSKDLFQHYKVPYPVQVLRNSFLILHEKVRLKLESMDVEMKDIFKTEDVLLNAIVKKESALQLNLEKEKAILIQYYASLKTVAAAVDITLTAHAENLCSKALKKIEMLEKKMLRSEKLKFEAQKRQLHKIKSLLFPDNGLQERVENFIPYYAQWGHEFIEQVYKNSLALEQQFCILLPH